MTEEHNHMVFWRKHTRNLLRELVKNKETEDLNTKLMQK